MAFDRCRFGSLILLPASGGCAPWLTEDQSTVIGTSITGPTGPSDRG
jgi:hypothetical protein